MKAAILTLTNLKITPGEPFAINLRGNAIPIKFTPHPTVRLADGTIAAAWKETYMGVLLSHDHTRHGQLLHLSISHRNRYPTWDEIAAVRYSLISDEIDMVMVLPKRSDYVNLHPNCFHLWQTPEEWGIR